MILFHYLLLLYHWPQFESCLKLSSDHGTICIKLDLVESEKVFSMKEIHAEPPFPCDYVRNGYCKRVIISTTESKRVFFLFFLITNCTQKMKILFTNPSARAGYDTRSIFKAEFSRFEFRVFLLRD